MLDCSRTFQSLDYLHRTVDRMAFLKMNVLHLHLTDDQGWRLEIKKYPKLTEVGAWRKDIGFRLDPKSSTAWGPDGRYGGFYTQAQIREIVAYARARHITVVPEIEMPGHSSAALSAFPSAASTPDMPCASTLRWASGASGRSGRPKSTEEPSLDTGIEHKN